MTLRHKSLIRPIEITIDHSRPHRAIQVHTSLQKTKKGHSRPHRAIKFHTSLQKATKGHSGPHNKAIQDHKGPKRATNGYLNPHKATYCQTKHHNMNGLWPNEA